MPARYRVQEYNFATSSATATEEFRSRESCIGYTGEGEEYPTGVSGEIVWHVERREWSHEAHRTIGLNIVGKNRHG